MHVNRTYHTQVLICCLPRSCWCMCVFMSARLRWCRVSEATDGAVWKLPLLYCVLDQTDFWWFIFACHTHVNKNVFSSGHGCFFICGGINMSLIGCMHVYLISSSVCGVSWVAFICSVQNVTGFVMDPTDFRAIAGHYRVRPGSQADQNIPTHKAKKCKWLFSL